MSDLARIVSETSCKLLGFDELKLVDAHCHLDFASDAPSIAQKGAQQSIGFFSGTVTPEGFERAEPMLAPYSNVKVGLGLHPWWITQDSFEAGAEGESSVERLLRLAGQTLYLNEVGLDFSSKHKHESEWQVKAFKLLLGALKEGSIVSLHSVKAADVVLDLLERYGAFSKATIIFHWFSGSSDQLQRACNTGCYFSVGERFLSSKKGREYLKVIAQDKLLLETDLPAQDLSHELAQSSTQESTCEFAQALRQKSAHEPTHEPVCEPARKSAHEPAHEPALDPAQECSDDAFDALCTSLKRAQDLLLKNKQ